MVNGTKKRLTSGKGKNGAALPLKRREVKPKSSGNKVLIKAQVKRAKEIAQGEFESARAEFQDLEVELDRTQQDEQLRDLLSHCGDHLKLLDQSASKRISDISSVTTKLLRTLGKEITSLDDGEEEELKNFAEDHEAKARKLAK